MARQRHLETLQRAYLPDARVASVGPPGELRGAAGALRVLDLQGALLPDWAATARLADELPELRVLDLRREGLAGWLVRTPLTHPPAACHGPCRGARWRGRPSRSCTRWC